MAEAIVMPRLGWTMTEGTLIEWLKEDGEVVEAGELLFTVESDKSVSEVETFSGGILHIPPAAPQPGDAVAIGAVLGYLLEPGEEKPGGAATTPDATAAAVSTSYTAEPTPARIVEQTRIPVSTALSTEPTISPRARRVAAELGVDWRLLAGKGREGRISENDVRAAAQAASTAPSAGELRPVTRIRKMIALHLGASARATVAVTLTTEADATELVSVRSKFRDSLGPEAPTYDALLIKLTARALGEHPLLNASWQEDQILVLGAVHLGMAVDTDDGLLVPVIRDAHAKSLQQIAADARSLATKARQGRLMLDDMKGGTFTLTNLGAYGIDTFTPIINLPQSAILGVGRIAEKPAVHDGQVVPRARMALSLTFDHRVLDGGPAARFLDRVRTFVEQPRLWLDERDQ